MCVRYPLHVFKPIFHQSNGLDMDFRVTAMLQMQRKAGKLSASVGCGVQRGGGGARGVSGVTGRAIFQLNQMHINVVTSSWCCLCTNRQKTPETLCSTSITYQADKRNEISEIVFQ